jgi:putative ABC transport system permease protein
MRADGSTFSTAAFFHKEETTMLWETFLLAQRAIRRNMLRSSLTVLGIVIGVAAVITMVTLGSGATAQVTSDISKLGSNMLQVRVGQGFGRSGGVRVAAPPFQLADASAIAHNVPGLQAVAPTTFRNMQAIYGNTNWSTSVTGSTSDFLIVRDWTLARDAPSPMAKCAPARRW